MKLTALILLIILSYTSKSQAWKLVDQVGKPIAFATIGIEGKNIGTYSFEDGSFTLPQSILQLEDPFTIQHAGFHTQKVRLDTADETITLKEAVTTLKEVIITPTTIQRIGLFQRKSNSDIAVDLPFNGSEVGTIVILPKGTHTLQKLFVNVRRENIPSFKIRGKVYSVLADRPASLIYQTHELDFFVENGPIEIPLTKSIEVKGKILIAFEWLVEKETARQVLIHYQSKKSLIDSVRVLYGGSINIYNDKVLEVTDSDGNIKEKIKLSRSVSRQLKEMKEQSPGLRFKTAKKDNLTYYRSHSFGKWYKYQQTLISGVEVSQLE